MKRKLDLNYDNYQQAYPNSINPTFLPNIHIPGNNSSRNIPTEHLTTTLFKTFNLNLEGNVPSVKQFY